MPYEEVPPFHGITGYPEEIFNERPRKVLRCSRKECGRVLKEPYQAGCGHRYCKECMEIVKALPQEDRFCYACYSDIYWDDAMEPPPRDVVFDVSLELRRRFAIDGSSCFMDTVANREVNRLLVHCPFKCETNLKSKEVEAHMKECSQRKVRCTECSSECSLNSFKQHQDRECPNRVVICPNSCGASGIMAKDLNEHKVRCRRRPEICRMCSREISTSLHQHFIEECRGACPFGCDKEEQQLIVTHFADRKFRPLHLLSLHEKLQQLQNTMQCVDILKTHYTSSADSRALPGLLKTLSQMEVCVAELSADTKAIAQAAGDLPSQGVRSEAVMRDSEYDRVNLVRLENQLAMELQRLQMLTAHLRVNEKTVERLEMQMERTDDTTQSARQMCYLHEARLTENELRMGQLQQASYDGRLIWRVNNVQALRQKALASERFSIYSPPFYSEVYGYKMCLRLYLNGDGNGKNSHVSLFFVVMRGEYDALLEWPFKSKVTLKLKNQTGFRRDIAEKFRPEPSSSSFERPKSDKNVASGCPQFAVLNEVFDRTAGFLVNDTIFVECFLDSPNSGSQSLSVKQTSMNRSNESPISSSRQKFVD